MKEKKSKEKKTPQTVKSKMHARNPHRERYDLAALTEAYAPLADHVRPNKYGDDSIDFADADAVKALNKAILFKHYDLVYWEIPEDYLCPPIPGRADYLHHVADLYGEKNFGAVPKGADFKCLDVGVGANCIYPIIGVKTFGWSFIGSEIDEVALENAKEIVEKNPHLKGRVDLRLQSNKRDVFHGILDKEEKVDLVICNPPFHASAEDAREANLRKVKNLHGKHKNKTALNFGGQSNELWTEGGEKRFLKDMVRSSKKFAENVTWFTALVSKENTVAGLVESLKFYKAKSVRIIKTGQGNKRSRIVAWSFTIEGSIPDVNEELRGKAPRQREASPRRGKELKFKPRTGRDPGKSRFYENKKGRKK